MVVCLGAKLGTLYRDVAKVEKIWFDEERWQQNQNMRFPQFGILVFISRCIVNQKYFDLEGSCESYNLIEIQFEDIIHEMDHKISTNPIVIVHFNMHFPNLFTKCEGIKLRG